MVWVLTQSQSSLFSLSSVSSCHSCYIFYAFFCFSLFFLMLVLTLSLTQTYKYAHTYTKAVIHSQCMCSCYFFNIRSALFSFITFSATQGRGVLKEFFSYCLVIGCTANAMLLQVMGPNKLSQLIDGEGKCNWLENNYIPFTRTVHIKWSGSYQ